jgi:pimeloyl-ACP methyl ester carboxylesterase
VDFLFVHGTTQSPAAWRPVEELLRQRGHRTVAVDLPTDRPELLAADYAAIARAQVGDALAPVLVGHSGAGLLMPAIARAVGASHLVWVAAMIPGPVSLADELAVETGEMFNPEWRGLTEPPTADPVVASYFLFHDCDLAGVRAGLRTLRLFYPAATYREVHPLPDLPSTCVLPRDDRTLRPSWMRRAARERLGVEAIEVDGGHCPQTSRPGTLAAVLGAVRPRLV